jgi:hypothetical protein
MELGYEHKILPKGVLYSSEQGVGFRDKEQQGC